MKWAHERAFYRIEYPSRERPSLEAKGVTYDVIDACETGIRYKLKNGEPQIGDVLEGVVRFRRGATAKITGETIRVQEGYAVLRLDPPGIPLKIILDEQRFLLKHYPRR